MADAPQSTPRRLVGPPDSWADLPAEPTSEQGAACDAAHDAWMAAPEGEAFLAADREIVAAANTWNIAYREAMEALGYVG